MEKLYCYVDETGQDTSGRLFIVAAVVVGSERELVRDELRRIEREAGKDRKWAKSKTIQKRAYVELLLQRQLRVALLTARFMETVDYFPCVADTVAGALTQSGTAHDYQATVLVDGMNKKEQHRLGADLRRRRIPVEKVRGLRDEADEFIRLADAAAGFARDVFEGVAYAVPLGERAAAAGLLVELQAKKNPRG